MYYFSLYIEYAHTQYNIYNILLLNTTTYTVYSMYSPSLSGGSARLDEGHVQDIGAAATTLAHNRRLQLHTITAVIPIDINANISQIQ